VCERLSEIAFRGSTHIRYLFALAVCFSTLLPRTGESQTDAAITPALYTYAVVVGSNPGGEGQNPLKFAEQDAQRVGELLGELGRYQSENVRVLLRPEPQQVLERLTRSPDL